MLQFATLMILGFLLLEAVSYVVHRWLFHGILWRIHRTHHESSRGPFEPNDLFSLLFGTVAAALVIFSEKSVDSVALPIGLGIVIYGIIYFIVHDLFTHRRFLRFGSSNRVMLAIRSAHQRHHQSIGKKGVEPFGLFLIDFRRADRT